MARLDDLLASNRAWSDRVNADDPEFFLRLSQQQAPKYLWIGCSDSRVPANQVIDVAPGEVFVHRNVANVVCPSDLNCLSVIQFAVDVLKVEHVIVVGHYGCGGVQTVLEDSRHGLVDNWLQHVRDVRHKHAAVIQALDPAKRMDRLCELNAIEQASNVCQTTVIRDAWMRGQPLTVHAWCYSLCDGRVRDIELDADNIDSAPSQYDRANRNLSAP